jgi:oxygen-independent coproporphyrinogen-3 oxidase
MIDAIVEELKQRSDYLKGEFVETIYFGGGTPSLINLVGLSKIIETIYSFFIVTDTPEITLETNPDDITLELVHSWKSVGINRLSIGIQSFDEEVLKWMNRAHNVTQSFQAIQFAKQGGISNITIDLMYGLPGLSLEAWEHQIERALSLQVQHISAYCLTVEKNTVLDTWVKSNKVKISENDDQALQFELLQKKLNENGFDHYEISNFGKPNFYSLHNSNYWKGEMYLGVGPSAHSYDTIHRSWNISNNHQYMNGVLENKPKFDFEILSKSDVFNELLLIGLRTIWGVDLKKLNSVLSFSVFFNNKLKELEMDELVYIEDNHLMLTQKGKFFADKIAQDLFV